MPTKRGWAAFAAGISLWVAARMVGSPDLHMLAAGIVSLPLLAAFVLRWNSPRFDVHRALSSTRAFCGSQVTVTLTVENRGRTATSYVLLEDSVPALLGKPARLVVAGIPPRNRQTVSYTVVCHRRGRFTLGPLEMFVTDAFGLARTRVGAGGESDLIVYPEVEDVDVVGLSAGGGGAGESTVRQPFRSAAEFYTMREYNTGDDLRRIHWPSVARTGQLMIRQDESSRRSQATLFLDTRSDALGSTGGPAFERAVSTAAALGRAFVRSGFTLRLATVDSPPSPVSEEVLLDTLAGIVASRTVGMVEAVSRLRSAALSDSSLAVVCAPPSPEEVATLSRVGSAFGRTLAVFVYPFPLSSLGVDVQARVRARATSAALSLQRAGWRTYLLHSDERLTETWQKTTTTKLQAAASSSV